MGSTITLINQRKFHHILEHPTNSIKERHWKFSSKSTKSTKFFNKSANMAQNPWTFNQVHQQKHWKLNTKSATSMKIQPGSTKIWINQWTFHQTHEHSIKPIQKNTENSAQTQPYPRRFNQIHEHLNQPTKISQNQRKFNQVN